MTAEDRRQAIVEAAMPLFARNGFAETTTRELARAAGVSEPLLYRHFPSKEALYVEIQSSCCHGKDPIVRKLSGLEPSTSSIVHLVYYVMRALVVALPAGRIDWDTRHRLMINSFLEDGAFARLLYRTRFDGFCAQMEACLNAALKAGDAVPSPASKHNLACFVHHVGAWLALVHLPAKPAINYKVSREELMHQAVWFALRGLGLTDKAISTHFNPKALALFFSES